MQKFFTESINFLSDYKKRDYDLKVSIGKVHQYADRREVIKY